MYFLQTTDDVLVSLGTSINGLSNKEVLKRQQQYGLNELPKKKKSLIVLFLHQFKDVMVYILIAALFISAALPILEGKPLTIESFLDAIVIFAILLLNAILGFADILFNKEEDENKKPYFLKIAIPKTKKNWAELELVTEEWVENEPNNTEAWYELGYAYEKLNKVADALVAYDKALEIDQNNSDALLREAVIYKKKGDENKVAQIQATLDDVDPNKAWILKNNKY